MAKQSEPTDIPDINAATESYEKWLAGFMQLSQDGLAQKHANMASCPFVFMRATYFRWAQQFTKICPELASAPQLLSVGDLHVENFGTWRDSEGRLVWGVNDFDEAAKLPYTNDLVRLALSAKLSLEEEQPAPIHWKAACAAIAEGYGDAMADAVERIDSVKPIVLAESHGWLAKLAADQSIDPEKFWNHLKHQAAPLKSSQRVTAAAILLRELPTKCGEIHWRQRSAGEGSLGRPRYLGLTEWQGGHVAREAKALAPSAAIWAGATPTKSICYTRILDSAIRSRDPFVHVIRFGKADWIIRRLLPDCHKIEMTALKGSIDEKLFHAMGHEVANVHLNQPKRCRAVLEHFHSLGPGSDWLADAVLDMERELVHDFEIWHDHANLP